MLSRNPYPFKKISESYQERSGRYRIKPRNYTRNFPVSPKVSQSDQYPIIKMSAPRLESPERSLPKNKSEDKQDLQEKLEEEQSAELNIESESSSMNESSSYEELEDLLLADSLREKLKDWYPEISEDELFRELIEDLTGFKISESENPREVWQDLVESAVESLEEEGLMTPEETIQRPAQEKLLEDIEQVGTQNSEFIDTVQKEVEKELDAIEEMAELLDDMDVERLEEMETIPEQVESEMPMDTENIDVKIEPEIEAIEPPLTPEIKPKRIEPEAKESYEVL